MSEEKTIRYLSQRVREYALTAKREGVGPPSDKSPFKEHGLIFIHQPSFRIWLSKKYKFYCSQPMAMEALTAIGAQRRMLNFGNKFGRAVFGINPEMKIDRVEEMVNG